MAKGFIRRFATVGLGLSFAFAMAAALPGCASNKCCGKDGSCCKKTSSTASKCGKGCTKPCCKKS